jgi:hypothetical protein
MKKHRCLVRVVLLLMVTTFALTCAMPAGAQFICAGSTDGSTGLGPQSATAAGSPGNVACGTSANASGASISNTAAGASANASGDNSANYHNVQLNGSFAYGFRENMAGGRAGLRFGF